MDFATLAHLGLKHARNALAEELYLAGTADITRPTMIYGIVNERCNYRCQYCEYWRLPSYKDELTIDEWKRALASLKELIGSFHIELSGGEPFVKKGFMDLCEWCTEAGIKWGVTTNGSSLTDKTIKRLVAARPFNFNMSIDSHIAEVHDLARGVDGSFERITAGLRKLVDERERAGAEFPIMLKPVVHRLNFRHLPELARWAKQFGPTVVNFQPVDRWTPETQGDLWIPESELPELERVVHELLRLKATGEAPIMNSELTMSVWPNHFRGETAPPETLPCLVGLRNYFIRPDGNVEVCWSYPPIGNVKRQSAREIWASFEAKRRREETTACDKLCLFTCLSQKTMVDRVKMGWTMLAARRPGARAATARGLESPGRTKRASLQIL